VFSIKVLSVQVQEHDGNGDAWDAAGGLPDPYVCMGISGKSACTATCDDTTTCTFTSATGGVIGGSSPLIFSGAELQNLGISVVDEDLSSNDQMGSATFALEKVQASYVTDPFGGVVSVKFVLY
jgi:Ca2+-dependent lipid-binding protein